MITINFSTHPSLEITEDNSETLKCHINVLKTSEDKLYKIKSYFLVSSPLPVTQAFPSTVHLVQICEKLHNLLHPKNLRILRLLFYPFSCSIYGSSPRPTFCGLIL